MIRFCDAVNVRADLDDAFWTGLSSAFGELAALEMLMLAGFYRMVSLVVNALRLPAEPGAVPFPPRS